MLESTLKGMLQANGIENGSQQVRLCHGGLGKSHIQCRVVQTSPRESSTCCGAWLPRLQNGHVHVWESLSYFFSRWSWYTSSLTVRMFSVTVVRYTNGKHLVASSVAVMHKVTVRMRSKRLHQSLVLYCNGCCGRSWQSIAGQAVQAWNLPLKDTFSGKGIPHRVPNHLRATLANTPLIETI